MEILEQDKKLTSLFAGHAVINIRISVNCYFVVFLQALLIFNTFPKFSFFLFRKIIIFQQWGP